MTCLTTVFLRTPEKAIFCLVFQIIQWWVVESGSSWIIQTHTKAESIANM